MNENVPPLSVDIVIGCFKTLVATDLNHVSDRLLLLPRWLLSMKEGKQVNTWL